MAPIRELERIRTCPLRSWVLDRSLEQGRVWLTRRSFEKFKRRKRKKCHISTAEKVRKALRVSTITTDRRLRMSTKRSTVMSNQHPRRPDHQVTAKTTKTCQRIIKSNVEKLSAVAVTSTPKWRCRGAVVSWTSSEVPADKNVITICKNFSVNWKKTTECKVSTTYCDTSLALKECRSSRSQFQQTFVYVITLFTKTLEPFFFHISKTDIVKKQLLKVSW